MEPKNELVVDLTDHGQGAVTLNGQELRSVRSIRFSAAPNGLNFAHITVLCKTIKLRADAAVKLRALTLDVLPRTDCDEDLVEITDLDDTARTYARAPEEGADVAS